MKRYGLVAISLGLTVSAVCGCNETFDQAVANPSAPAVHEYIAKGWMPAASPMRMRNVRLSGDQDAGRAVGTFQSEDVSLFLSTCSVTTGAFEVETALPGWFPSEVRDADTSDELRKQGYTTYQCNDDFSVIRKGSEKTLYFWSEREDDD